MGFNHDQSAIGVMGVFFFRRLSETMPDQSAMVTCVGLWLPAWWCFGHQIFMGIDMVQKKKDCRMLGWSFFQWSVAGFLCLLWGVYLFFPYPYSPYICWKPHPPEKNRKFSNVSVELIVLLNYKPLETVARCRDCNDPGVLNSHIFIYVPYKKPRFLRFPEASESWAKSCWAIFKLNVHAPKSEICWRSFLGLPQT